MHQSCARAAHSHLSATRVSHCCMSLGTIQPHLAQQLLHLSIIDISRHTLGASCMAPVALCQPAVALGTQH